MTKKESEVKREITILLREVGILAKRSGYTYLTEAIWLCINDFTFSNSITGRLYPTVAKKFNSTDKRVEKAIRYAIMVADDNKMEKKFTKRPTNKELIVTIAEEICNID